MASLLGDCFTASAAVDDWVKSIPALIELGDEFSFFRPMIKAIALDMLKKARLLDDDFEDEEVAEKRWVHQLGLDLEEMTTAAASYSLPQVYSPAELAYLEKGRAVITSFEALKHENLRTGTKLVKGYVSVGGETVSAKATGNIRSSKELVCAYLMSHNHRYQRALDEEDADIIEKVPRDGEPAEEEEHRSLGRWRGGG